MTIKKIKPETDDGFYSPSGKLNEYCEFHPGEPRDDHAGDIHEITLLVCEEHTECISVR